MDEIQRHYTRSKNPDEEPYLFNDNKSQNSENACDATILYKEGHVKFIEHWKFLYLDLSGVYKGIYVIKQNEASITCKTNYSKTTYFIVCMLGFNRNTYIHNNHRHYLHFISLSL